MHRPRSPWRLPLLLAGCILSLSGTLAAQQPALDSVRSTRTGVYTAGQATEGGNLYALNCASCHTPATHAGPTFAAKWDHRPLSELFGYMRRDMPKNDPGTLSKREYTLVLAYLLKLNGMPAGSDELPADSVAMKKIRLDLTDQKR